MTDLETATGRNLDNVGTIIPLTRKEAGMLAGANSQEYVILDERYRLYLKYKLLSITSECTYDDIIAAARMFWDGHLRYSEPSDEPASYHLDAYVQDQWQDVGDLLRAPAIRSAGVGTGITVHFPEVKSSLRIGGQESVNAEMPLTVVADVFSFEASLRIGGGMGILPDVTVPPIEDALRMESTLRLGGRARLISEVAAHPAADRLIMENTVRVGRAAVEIVSRSIPPAADTVLFERTLHLGGTAAIVTTLPIAGNTLIFRGGVNIGFTAELSVKLPVPIALEVHTFPPMENHQSFGVLAEIQTVIGLPQREDIFINTIRTGGLEESAVFIPVPEIK